MSLPNANKVYEQLITPNRRGVYASLGRWYNNALFARDNLVTARMLLHQKPELALEVIRTCVWFQGQKQRPLTGEEPGKIFHEYRNLQYWKGNTWDRLRAQFWSYLWNRSTSQLLTYYNFDNTASFILLVDAYCRRHGDTILDQYFERAKGNRITLRQSVAEALNWVHGKMDTETGIFWFHRYTPWELLNQVWKDSPTAYVNEDGKLPPFTKPTAYLITQTLCAEALLKSPNLLEADSLLSKKLQTSTELSVLAIMKFWLEDQQYFSPLATKNKKSVQFFSCPTSDVVWLMVSDVMRLLPQYQTILESSVRQLFGSEFLTDAGIRSRSLRHQPASLPVIDYHGSCTVWPFDAYMLWAGLRKQGFRYLAQAIENRCMLALNKAGNYREYFIADHNGHIPFKLKLLTTQLTKKAYQLQFAPESNQAWTLAACINMNQTPMRISGVHKTAWKKKLDKSLFESLPSVRNASEKTYYYNEQFGFFRLLWHYRRDTLKTLFNQYSSAETEHNKIKI